MEGTRRKVPVSLNLARPFGQSHTDLQVPVGLVTHLYVILVFPPSPSLHPPFVFFSPNPTPLFTASILFFELSLPRYTCFFLAFSHSLRYARFFETSCILYNLHLDFPLIPRTPVGQQETPTSHLGCSFVSACSCLLVVAS